MPRIIVYGVASAVALALFALCARHRLALARASTDVAQNLGEALKSDQQAGIGVQLP